MKDDRAWAQSIRAAINDCTRGLDNAPSLQYRIARKAKGEEPMAKKISTVLVAALVLMAVTVTTLAAALLWRDAGNKIAPLEKNNGYYDTWNTAAKIELVRTLYELGELKGNADAERLINAGDMGESEKDALCDQIMAAYLSGAPDTVTLLSILEKLHGDMDTWSMEDKVWYNELLAENGMLSQEDERYILPQGGEIGEEQAVEAARAFLIGKGAMDLDSAQVAATMSEQDGRRVWSLRFILDKEGLPYGGSCHATLSADDGSVICYAVPELVPVFVTGMLPDAEAIGEEQAVEAGRKAIAEAFSLGTGDLSGLRAHYGLIDLDDPGRAHAQLGDRVWIVLAGTGHYAMMKPSGEMIFVGSIK